MKKLTYFTSEFVRLHERSSETSRADVGVRSGGYVIAMGISRLVRIVRDQADLAGPE